MSEHLTWWVGDRNPSIQDVLTVGGVPVDLSAKTAQFRMRAVGATTLKIDQPVTFKDALGNWRYDWAANDLDTAGRWLVWLEVTTGTKRQTLWESLIEVREHGDADLPVYLELEQFKSTLTVTGTQADLDARRAISAASRVIDQLCNRHFYPDSTTPTEERLFRPISPRLVRIDDLIELGSVKIDRDGTGGYTETWVLDDDFTLEPTGNAARGRPYEQIRRHEYGAYEFPLEHPHAVRVTGRFGWLGVPSEVEQATHTLATRYMVIARQAPLGILALGDGSAVRLAKNDPTVMGLLSGLVRGSGRSGMGLA